MGRQHRGQARVAQIFLINNGLAHFAMRTIESFHCKMTDLTTTLNVCCQHFCPQAIAATWARALAWRGLHSGRAPDGLETFERFGSERIATICGRKPQHAVSLARRYRKRSNRRSSVRQCSPVERESTVRRVRQSWTVAPISRLASIESPASTPMAPSQWIKLSIDAPGSAAS